MVRVDKRINKKTTYVYESQPQAGKGLIRRIYDGTHSRDYQELRFNSRQHFKDLIEMLSLAMSDDKGFFQLNGWTLEAETWSEDDCWLNPEKEGEIQYIRIQNGGKDVIYAEDYEEVQDFLEFLKSL